MQWHNLTVGHLSIPVIVATLTPVHHLMKFKTISLLDDRCSKLTQKF